MKLFVIILVTICLAAAARAEEEEEEEIIVPQTRPLYFISASDEVMEPAEFLSRSGLPTSSEELKEETTSSELRVNGTSRMTEELSQEMNRNRRFPPRRRKQNIKADPGSLDREEFEIPDSAVKDENKRGVLSRFLWPFSLSVSKGGKGHHHHHDHGHGTEHYGPPHHLGYYSSYPHSHGHHHGKGWNKGFQGLSEHDEWILESKGYQKYQLKKKKKIKKLKKKLKLKRILQKILEKKIDYFDSLGIEGGGW